MPNYRRAHIPGATYFFTAKTENNATIFNSENSIIQLKQVIQETRKRWPFEIPAIVVLPDHIHTIWELPRDDSNFSIRWSWLKKELTKRYLKEGGIEQPISLSRERNRRRGVWQRRYWEHVIKDEDDYEAHFDYIHWNPVKHGYVQCPSEWKYSLIHRWIERGIYDARWGCGQTTPYVLKQTKEMGE
ncbi:MAG: transposase [Rubinisphaera sp.]|uniref:REP-associated tyrosine transposase n=1 Tax=Rubinisphaera sp. TaxID=2024857 RepID=UPI000C0F8405|nr:transposase [Rubinisphaera sp.]MBV07718.1 transposase [Rubinisphaera sp.]|tara:strand:+ start:150 stop:710 length:561 start_codon:yes stop_codon:yes gene_type:complete